MANRGWLSQFFLKDMTSSRLVTITISLGVLMGITWWCLGPSPGGLPEMVKSEERFKEGVSSSSSSEGAVHEFVMSDASARTAACHASTLVETPEGDIIVAWFGGSAEGLSDVGIWASHRTAQIASSKGPAWSRPQLVAKVSDEAHWNPVLFWGHQGRLFIHFKVGDSIPLWRTYFCTSEDQGKTWTSPKELVPGDEGGRGCVKNKPLILQDGTLICGASTEEDGWNAFVDISTDEGRTFKRTPDLTVPDGAGIIQPTLWESAPGKVHMLLRSDAHHVYRADSEDGGRTWGSATPIKLPNNNSGLDVVLLKGGTLVLAYNPVSDNWGGRWPLRLSLSTDNGYNWIEQLDLETTRGEYSYPAIIPWANGEGIHLSYTWNRQKIRYFSVSLEELHQKTTTPK